MTELMRPSRWAERLRAAAAPPPLTAASVFDGLQVADPEVAAPPCAPEGPVAVYLAGPDDSWCSGRRGVWWPALGVWVDRRELSAADVTPAGARTYPLLPPPGHELVAVHGQEVDAVGHVLVTGPAGEVVTQASARVESSRDRAILVLSTLILAAGRGSDPTRLLEQTIADRVVSELGGEGWAAPGWSRDVVDLPGRVVRALQV